VFEKDWVTTPTMAKVLGIHYSTLLRLRRDDRSPFRNVPTTGALV